MSFLASIKRLLRRHEERIGLVLSSGGARGFAHIGVLKVLEEEAIPIHCIAGSSAGALIGGLYASGTPLAKIEELVVNLSLKDMARLFLPSFERGGIIDGDRVKKFIEPLATRKLIEDSSPRFACVATDLYSGEDVVFKKGNLLEAIRASIAIPGVFTPAIYNDRVLVDGGVVNPLPIDIAFDMGATFVIAVNINRTQFKYPLGELERDKPMPSIIESVLSSLSIIESKLIHAQISKAGRHILIEPELGNIDVHHFLKGKEGIKAGAEAMRGAIPKLPT